MRERLMGMCFLLSGYRLRHQPVEASHLAVIANLALVKHVIDVFTTELLRTYEPYFLISKVGIFGDDNGLTR